MQTSASFLDKEQACVSGSVQKLRLLVVIASYGIKNVDYLRNVIRAYHAMDLKVDVTVISEAPKQLGERVRVVAGLPAKNPWTLPFAHKGILVDNVERYDLFIYSEDDIEVTEGNIRAFLRVAPKLKPSEIAGYLRYEIDDVGNRLLTDVHGSFHWEPGSVRRRGEHVIAELTNEHAGFYLLTRDQLRRVIASGDFLTPPYEGRYGLPETAATDVYTRCGFRKVICISDFEDFLIRHMSNLYVRRHGLPLDSCREQIQALLEIGNGSRRATVLCQVEPKVLQRNWSKCIDERPVSELLNMIPADARSILSIGCGCGDTEARLSGRGAVVTALPLNSVVGASLQTRGIEVINGTLNECLDTLNGRQFDCVLITNILHLLADPWKVLRDCSRLIGSGGALVIGSYNFEFLPHFLKRLFGAGDYRKLRRFEESGVHPLAVGVLKTQLRKLGLTDTSAAWFDYARPQGRLANRRWFGRLLAKRFVIQAKRCSA